MLPPELKRWGILVRCKKGDVVVTKKQETRHVYLVLSGALVLQASMADGNFYSYAQLGPGHYAGDMEILSGQYAYVATLIASEDTELVRFPAEAFEAAIDGDAAYFRHVVRQLSMALYDTSYNRGQNKYQTSRQKLCRLLLRYYDTMPGPPVRIPATRQQMASAIGVTVRTVDRAVHALRGAGLVGFSRGKVEITGEQHGLLLKELEG